MISHHISQTEICFQSQNKLFAPSIKMEGVAAALVLERTSLVLDRLAESKFNKATDFAGLQLKKSQVGFYEFRLNCHQMK